VRPNYNAAPGQDVKVLCVVREAGGQRQGVVMRWGLIPSWAKGEPGKFSTFNRVLRQSPKLPPIVAIGSKANDASFR
jgi:putative SOS response-associated peptidase YedK